MWAGTPRFWASSSLSSTRASRVRSSPLRAQRSSSSVLFTLPPPLVQRVFFSIPGNSGRNKENRGTASGNPALPRNSRPGTLANAGSAAAHIKILCCSISRKGGNAYFRSMASFTLAMMWAPMSREASTVWAPRWGVTMKLSHSNRGESKPAPSVRPPAASSFSMTSEP